MKTQGRKEIFEATLIAGLCAFVTAIVNWSVEESRRKVEEARVKAEQAKKKGKKSK